MSGEVGGTYSATASASRTRRADINIDHEVKNLAQAFSRVPMSFADYSGQHLLLH